MILIHENLVSFLITILSESLFASSQFSKDSSSAILNNIYFVLWKIKMFVSSANNFCTAVLNAFEMSFMYIRNRRGPSTEPCGTPHSTVFNDDVTPLTFVNCLRLLK